MGLPVDAGGVGAACGQMEDGGSFMGVHTVRPVLVGAGEGAFVALVDGFIVLEVLSVLQNQVGAVISLGITYPTS